MEAEPDTSNVVPQEKEVEAQQKDHTDSKSDAGKKRKEIDMRSKAWEHFERVKDASGVTVKGRCIYCGKKINAHSKLHDTSFL